MKHLEESVKLNSIVIRLYSLGLSDSLSRAEQQYYLGLSNSENYIIMIVKTAVFTNVTGFTKTNLNRTFGNS